MKKERRDEDFLKKEALKGGDIYIYTYLTYFNIYTYLTYK
jgi:hypothetical protein